MILYHLKHLELFFLILFFQLLFHNEKYNLNGVDIPYYKFSKSNLIKNIKLPPMAEGIFYINNELYILFENSSNTYFYAFKKLKKIIKLNI